ncbi:MAG: hypothetical protein HDS99_01300 [Bacteroidales bacterium]|nr:hypothetical protein [Bacteroidales bacterium]
MDFSYAALNFNSVVTDDVAMLLSIENLPGFEARAAFTVNSESVFREDVDIVPTIVYDTLSYVPWATI